MTQKLPPVGAFLATSWGYDQTNVEFYRVVGHTKSGKSVVLQQWAAWRHESSSGSCDYLVPGGAPAVRTVWEDIPEGERGDTPWETRRAVGVADVAPFVHRARWHGDSTTILGHYAKVWDGKPQYATATGWGH